MPVIGMVAISLISLSSSPALGRVVCEPFPPLPAADLSVLPKPKWVPTEFPVRVGGSDGTPLVFVGDSLTVGNGATGPEMSYPAALSRDMGNRAFVSYALPGQTSTKLAELFANTTVSDDAVGIIWVGQNNTAKSEAVVADAVAISAKFTSGKYLVLSLLKGRWWSQQPGNQSDIEMDRTDRMLEQKFGPHFVDMNNTLDCDDFKDNTHPNDQGNAKIAALIMGELVGRGW